VEITTIHDAISLLGFELCATLRRPPALIGFNQTKDLF
jgi:HD-like signal output (HDOD) protein